MTECMPCVKDCSHAKLTSIATMIMASLWQTQWRGSALELIASIQQSTDLANEPEFLIWLRPSSYFIIWKEWKSMTSSL